MASIASYNFILFRFIHIKFERVFYSEYKKKEWVGKLGENLFYFFSAVGSVKSLAIPEKKTEKHVF
jgi:hypothetical protein